MPIHNFQIANPFPNELRPDQAPRELPLFGIGAEYGIAQELLPLIVKSFAFTKIVELCC